MSIKSKKWFKIPKGKASGFSGNDTKFLQTENLALLLSINVLQDVNNS